ncbi:alpha/beta hydrolase [Micromonospora matsumotoense]|uniref:alpha/beta hydrolase n=1 Tax=Micromonospora matsumotoense TaxID=121616 RepID=UPI003CCB9CF5
MHRAAVAAAEGRNARIAVIAWLGYRPPGGVGLAATRQRLATLGAVELLHVVDGLAVVRPRAAITVGRSRPLPGRRHRLAGAPGGRGRRGRRQRLSGTWRPTPSRRQ